MSMFCFQCQETVKNQGCTIRGVCGKEESTAHLQDLLIFNLKGIGAIAQALRKEQKTPSSKVGSYILFSLFSTITNANFNNAFFEEQILKGFALKEELLKNLSGNVPEWALWQDKNKNNWNAKALEEGVLATTNEDVRSLRQLVIYGLKGMAAYAEHAAMLNKNDDAIISFMEKALAATKDDSLSVDNLVALVLETGEVGVKTMALLDEANTSTYGNPEPTKVNIGVGKNPGILISGHDLKDLEELLEQTKNQGVDIYTHSEMLPANSYPFFKKYPHLKGNYGNAWWKQVDEIEKFGGPILFTTNCLVPPKDSYKNRIYTTGPVGFTGCAYIEDRKPGKQKDFSKIIAHAKTCPPPQALEEGTINGGYAHHTVLSVADKIISLIKEGKIKKFVVMGGCDGRFPSRAYFTEFAQALPKDTIILTAGCAKYRYNKLPLGEIDGIPRVLDAGQCNDSYSLAYIALKLKEALGLNDINELPIVYNIAWYEQKAVLVLLALLYLGVKNIHLGPTLPAFVSPHVLKVLVEKFNIAPSGKVDEDIKKLIG